MKSLFIVLSVFSIAACSKKQEEQPVQENFLLRSVKINGVEASSNVRGVTFNPVVQVAFAGTVDTATVSKGVLLSENGSSVPYNLSIQNDSVLNIRPIGSLQPLSRYTLDITTNVRTKAGTSLSTGRSISILTAIDSSNKFPVISDSALLDLVQKQTFKYFWDFGHPVSGLARERNTSGDVVTSGGSGFGIMAIIVAANRNFITRADALARMQKITVFLKNTAQKFHGAFPHWLNGTTGQVVPFSAKDNGADLVETAYLMQGLLTARQYFNQNNTAESGLRNDINNLWQGVEWSWFRKNNENVLYWHWSPNYNWDMNVQIKGWNECLITYALAASSPTYSIPKIVYDEGWASNGGMINNNTYYGVRLPLGFPSGGPLFFAHYSFLGINPNGLTDAYARYDTQNIAHTRINYNYCVANPRNYYGYSNSCWGLTASDDNQHGYMAHEPNNDNGVISPTAALSSFPYTPVESMRALKFFYYKLGDRVWKDYGFIDAFSLDAPWFADSFLAIDQGPEIVMIENYRSGLLWNLFMSCPEVKTGMKGLGFTSPYL